MGGGEVHNKLSSLAVYTEGAKWTIFFHEIQVQGKLFA